ncbi:serpin family protein [Ornithinibacillus halotolerans]|uniref:serpin family protein n=1 Tax=Ornithinibacillus halotolerans TaxID=1274357 RepID=UPI001667E74F|nr:serpin family protein [Ornithinibacillus halotolerans]
MVKFLRVLLLTSICTLIVSCGEKNVNAPIIHSDVEFGKTDYKKIVRANNQLGFDLLPLVDADSDGNILLSPTSLYMALSMIYNGADGETKKEIADILHVDGVDAQDLNKANASWMNILHKNSDEIQLQIANSIWLNERFHFQEEFANHTEDYFHATIEEIAIGDSDSTKRMNNWVKEATNKKIDGIVEPPLDPDLVSILLNAIYFKGDWKYAFDKKQTEVGTFHLSDNIEKEIAFMTLHEKISYQENEYFQAVSLPYGEEEMSMKVFLPNKEIELVEFINLLTEENWKKWNAAFKQKQGTVVLPSFQVEYDVHLNDVLKNLGMNGAFTNEANFTKMVDEKVPIWISEIKQKTFIEVHEEGTEAAAVTSVVVVTESTASEQPFYMKVDRPFFFVITDDKSGSILFVGRITNPQG